MRRGRVWRRRLMRGDCHGSHRCPDRVPRALDHRRLLRRARGPGSGPPNRRSPVSSSRRTSPMTRPPSTCSAAAPTSRPGRPASRPSTSGSTRRSTSARVVGNGAHGPRLRGAGRRRAGSEDQLAWRVVTACRSGPADRPAAVGARRHDRARDAADAADAGSDRGPPPPPAVGCRARPPTPAIAALAAARDAALVAEGRPTRRRDGTGRGRGHRPDRDRPRRGRAGRDRDPGDRDPGDRCRRDRTVDPASRDRPVATAPVEPAATAPSRRRRSMPVAVPGSPPAGWSDPGDRRPERGPLRRRRRPRRHAVPEPATRAGRSGRGEPPAMGHRRSSRSSSRRWRRTTPMRSGPSARPGTASRPDARDARAGTPGRDVVETLGTMRRARAPRPRSSCSTRARTARRSSINLVVLVDGGQIEGFR